MSWEAIGAIGQVFGALALIFVVVQVRHARAEMTRSTRLARTDALLSLIQDQIADPSRIELQTGVAQALGGQPGQFQAAMMERAGVT